MDLNSAIKAKARVRALIMIGQDHRAFFKAFKAKQKPTFQDKYVSQILYRVSQNTTAG